MATFTKRGKSWRAEVRLKGHRPVTKSFPKKSLAEAWAREQEAVIREGESPAAAVAPTLTVSDLLARYEREVTPRKRGAAKERSVIRQLDKGLGHHVASQLSADHLLAWADDRLRTVKSDTVRRNLAVLRRIYHHARDIWSLQLDQPVERALKVLEQTGTLLPPAHRDRRVELWEVAAILGHVTQPMAEIVCFLFFTAMRRSEAARLRWDQVDIKRQVITFEVGGQKNRRAAEMPIGRSAVAVLEGVNRSGDRVWGVFPDSVTTALDRACEKAGIKGLRLHDLRHERVSRCFEGGMALPEVAMVSRHRDWRSLKRYTNIKPETVAAKLD